MSDILESINHSTLLESEEIDMQEEDKKVDMQEEDKKEEKKRKQKEEKIKINAIYKFAGAMFFAVDQKTYSFEKDEIIVVTDKHLKNTAFKEKIDQLTKVGKIVKLTPDIPKGDNLEKVNLFCKSL